MTHTPRPRPARRRPLVPRRLLTDASPMESTTPTEEYRDSRAQAGPGDATGVVQPALATVAGAQCANCGAHLAADQRYCVECGQRRGQAGMPFTDVRRGPEAPVAARRPRRVRVSPNSTLIAGVGTLLLAMGVGVLIGRSGNDAPRSVPAQVVTVGAPGGAVAATSTPAGATPADSAASKKNAGATKKTTAKSTSAGKAPPKAVVKVGTPGKGPGYQHGKFTGNFFGP